MTGLTNSGNSSKHQRKGAGFIDMTPMVELGVLLITFFILTAALVESKAFGLIMPAQGPPSRASAFNTLTVLLDKEDVVSYYHGQLRQGDIMEHASYHTQMGIGKIIREKQRTLGDKRNDLTIIINSSGDATYNNLVNILDEIKISGVTRCAIVDKGQ